MEIMETEQYKIDIGSGFVYYRNTLADAEKLAEMLDFDISKKFVVAKNWYDYPHLTNEFRKCEIKKIN